MSWADDHGYYHWTCNRCGLRGWTDTEPDCACPRCANCGKQLAREDDGPLCAKCEKASAQDVEEDAA